MFNVVVLLLTNFLIRLGVLFYFTDFTAFTLLHALINKDRVAARKQENRKSKNYHSHRIIQIEIPSLYSRLSSRPTSEGVVNSKLDACISPFQKIGGLRFPLGHSHRSSALRVIQQLRSGYPQGFSLEHSQGSHLQFGFQQSGLSQFELGERAIFSPTTEDVSVLGSYYIFCNFRQFLSYPSQNQ